MSTATTYSPRAKCSMEHNIDYDTPCLYTFPHYNYSVSNHSCCIQHTHQLGLTTTTQTTTVNIVQLTHPPTHMQAMNANNHNTKYDQLYILCLNSSYSCYASPHRMLGAVAMYQQAQTPGESVNRKNSVYLLNSKYIAIHIRDYFKE